MKIRFQPRRGTAHIEIRDIKGGDPLAAWRIGDVRDIPAGSTVLFQEPGGAIVQKDAATALFSCGPDFVDDATGKNPLYSCSGCGEPALEEHFVNHATLDVLYLLDESDKRQCLACWLGAHPQYISVLRAQGTPADVLNRAQAIANKTTTSTASRPVVAAVTKPEAED